MNSVVTFLRLSRRLVRRSLSEDGSFSEGGCLRVYTNLRQSVSIRVQNIQCKSVSEIFKYFRRFCISFRIFSYSFQTFLYSF